MSFGKGKSVLLAVLFMYLLGLVQVLPAYAETRLPPPAANSASEAPVVVIPVHQTIESGLQKFMERSVRSAEQARASYIILDINTLGGRVDSAEGIGELIRSSSVPTIAYIHGKAVSAGSYIALNASAIIMEPGSSIGAAAVVDITGNEIESAKVISHWSSQMRSAAELRGRKPLIAEGMVDKNLVVAMPEIGRTAEKGQIVSLTADEALKVGYAERSAKDMKEVLAFLGAENRPVITEEPSPAEKFARILTDPFIATLRPAGHYRAARLRPLLLRALHRRLRRSRRHRSVRDRRPAAYYRNIRLQLRDTRRCRNIVLVRERHHGCLQYEASTALFNLGFSHRHCHYRSCRKNLQTSWCVEPIYFEGFFNSRGRICAYGREILFDGPDRRGIDTVKTGGKRRHSRGEA
jgi:hypothetical protein